MARKVLTRTEILAIIASGGSVLVDCADDPPAKVYKNAADVPLDIDDTLLECYPLIPLGISADSIKGIPIVEDILNINDGDTLVYSVADNGFIFESGGSGGGGGGIGGSGTTGRFPKFSGSATLTNSILSESSGVLSLISPSGADIKFDPEMSVTDNINVTGNANKSVVGFGAYGDETQPFPAGGYFTVSSSTTASPKLVMSMNNNNGTTSLSLYDQAGCIYSDSPAGLNITASDSAGVIRLGAGGDNSVSSLGILLSADRTTSFGGSLLSLVSGLDLGSVIKPFRDLYLYGSGTYGTNYFNITGTPTGGRILTLPNITDFLVSRNSTDTFTNKTFDTAGSGNSFSIAGVSVTANTGTGAIARATSPNFTTPVLGVATGTSLVLTDTTANSFIVGPNGATNPTFRVSCNAASAATGVRIGSGAAGAGATVTVTSTATDENLSIIPKGAGTIVIPSANVTKLSNLTTNGFIKSSSSNGTLTVDTNTYLTSSDAVTSITGTADQVNASAPTGAVTLSLPQSIASTSKPQFAALGIGQAAPTTGISVTDTTVVFSTSTAGTRIGSTVAQKNLELINLTTSNHGRISWFDSSNVEQTNTIITSFLLNGSQPTLLIGANSASVGDGSSSVPFAIYSANQFGFQWPETDSKSSVVNIGGLNSGGDVVGIGLYNYASAAVNNRAVIRFDAKRTTSGRTNFATIASEPTNIGDATYAGDLVFKVSSAATLAEAFRIKSTGAVTPSITLNNTGLLVFDTDASHTLNLKPGSNLTANRTLTLTTGDSDRVIDLSGNLTLAGAFTTSGANALTLTTTGTTGVTLPVTGTLSTLAGAETLTNKTIASPTFTGTAAGASFTASGTIVQTSNSAAAFESGPNGSTNPVFRLVNSVASAATGLSIQGNAASAGVLLSALSSTSTEHIFLSPKGGTTGTVVINSVNTNAPPGSAVLQLVAENRSDFTIFVDTFQNPNPGFVGRFARGTMASPTQAQTNDGLVIFAGRGYTSGGAYSGTSSVIFLTAAENFTSSAQGSYIRFETTPVGSTTSSRAERLRIRDNGDINIISGALGFNSATAPTANLSSPAASVLRIGGTTTAAGSLIIGPSTASIGTSGVSVLAVGGSTMPTSQPADEGQIAVTDFAAGDARFRFLSEIGSRITIGNDQLAFATGTTDDLFIGRAAAANLRLGAPDVASPVAQSISAQNVLAGTTDTAGVSLTIKGSQGTGTGLGGPIILQTSPVGTTGTSQNALVDVARFTTTSGNATIQLGGSTSSFPALFRNSTTLDIKRADNSAYTNVQAADFVALGSLRIFSAQTTTNLLKFENAGTADLFLGRAAAANLRLGAADAATAVAQTLSVQSIVAGTSNVAGANLTVTGSIGTGTGAGGSIIIRVAPAGTSGTSQNALVTALTIDNTAKVNVGVGVNADSGGIKHSRVTTGSVTAGATALVTVTWTTAFADANYSVMANVLDSTTSNLALSVVHIESVTASAVTVRVINNSVGSLTGTLHVVGIHD